MTLTPAVCAHDNNVQLFDRQISNWLIGNGTCIAVSVQVSEGYTQLALADAQSITVLRAIQKGNAPSLIAALARNTANMYQAAAQAFKQVAAVSNTGSKQGRYAEWKLLVFQGYMYTFTGNQEAGQHKVKKDVASSAFAHIYVQSASYTRLHVS